MFILGLIGFALAVWVAVSMVQAGLLKINGELSAVSTFESLGGDKARLFVGWTEVLCGALFPFAPLLGFPLLVVMAGAIYLHVKVWNNSAANALNMVALIVGSMAARAF